MKVIDGGTKRKYYKWGTELNSQIIQNGGTLSNGVYTGGNGAYLRLPIMPYNASDTWEFQTVYTHNGGGGHPTILAPSTASYGAVLAPVRGTFVMSMGRTGSDPFASLVTTVAYTTGTTYYIKIGFTGAQYYFSYNTDGSDNYTTETVSSTTKVNQTVAPYLMNWGWNVSNYYASGSIDLPKTRFYFDGNLYFSCTEPIETDETDYDWYEDVEVREVVGEENNGITTYYAVRN